MKDFLKKNWLVIVFGLALLIVAAMYFTKDSSNAATTDDQTIVTTPPTATPTTPTPTAPVSGEIRFNIRIDGGYWLPDGDNNAITGQMVSLNPQGNGRDFVMKPGDSYHNGDVSIDANGKITVKATYVSRFGSMPYLSGALTGYQPVAMSAATSASGEKIYISQ